MLSVHLRFSIIWVNLMTHYPMPLELVHCLTCQRTLIMFTLFLVWIFLMLLYTSVIKNRMFAFLSYFEVLFLYSVKMG